MRANQSRRQAITEQQDWSCLWHCSCEKRSTSVTIGRSTRLTQTMAEALVVFARAHHLHQTCHVGTSGWKVVVKYNKGDTVCCAHQRGLSVNTTSLYPFTRKFMTWATLFQASCWGARKDTCRDVIADSILGLCSCNMHTGA
jgi:hypothetical protein